VPEGGGGNGLKLKSLSMGMLRTVPKGLCDLTLFTKITFKDHGLLRDCVLTLVSRVL
jgi:hypothetical protein